MPNLGLSPAPVRAHASRVIVVVIALIIASGAALADIASVAAVDLSPRISATRNNQIAAERVMRGADKRIKSTKRGLKKHQRKVKRLDRRVGEKKARRAAASGELRQVRRTLDEARAARLRPFTVPEFVAGPAEPPVPDVIPGAVPTPAAIELAVDELQETDDGEAAPILTLPPSAAEMDALRSKVKAEKKQLRMAKKKLRKAQRQKRSSVRKIRILKNTRRAAVVQRNGSERALGGWIKSMTKLAKKRAAKKFKVRPGVRGSRFIRPSDGRLSQGYHRGHDGLDIVSYHSAPIRAAAAGVVAYVGWNPWDKGKRAFVVVLGHGSGYETIYGHLRPIRRVRVGQEIRKGQVIGNMGNTGHSTGTHVHFEVSRNWRTLNPAYVL